LTYRTIAWVCGLFLSLGLTPGCAEIRSLDENPAWLKLYREKLIHVATKRFDPDARI
jgi:hypothetical protein